MMQLIQGPHYANLCHHYQAFSLDVNSKHQTSSASTGVSESIRLKWVRMQFEIFIFLMHPRQFTVQLRFRVTYASEVKW